MSSNTAFKKNYPKFERFMKEICRLNKIKIIKKDIKENFSCGYFYVNAGRAVIEIPTYVTEETFLVIGHEFGHALQYIAKDENLVGKIDGLGNVTEIFYDWLSGKDFAPEFIAEIKQRIKLLELGAEEKLIEFNRIFKLGISEKWLWKAAFAYSFQLEYMWQYRTIDLRIYHLEPSVLSKMPSNEKAKSAVIADSSPKIIQIIASEHEKAKRA